MNFIFFFVFDEPKLDIDAEVDVEDVLSVLDELIQSSLNNSEDTDGGSPVLDEEFNNRLLDLTDVIESDVTESPVVTERPPEGDEDHLSLNELDEILSEISNNMFSETEDTTTQATLEATGSTIPDPPVPDETETGNMAENTSTTSTTTKLMTNKTTTTSTTSKADEKPELRQKINSDPTPIKIPTSKTIATSSTSA